MLDISPGEINLRTIVQAVRQLIQGRNNANGQITLVANQATTVIDDETINAAAGIHLEPATANAAAEKAAGTMYSAVTAGQVTITHATNAQTDRTFYYVVLGG